MEIQAFDQLLDFFLKATFPVSAGTVVTYAGGVFGSATIAASLERLRAYEILLSDEVGFALEYNRGPLFHEGRGNRHIPGPDARGNVLKLLRAGITDRQQLRLFSSTVDSTFNRALAALVADGVVTTDGNGVQLSPAYATDNKASAFDLEESMNSLPTVPTYPCKQAIHPFQKFLDLHHGMRQRLRSLLRLKYDLPTRATNLGVVLRRAPYSVMSIREAASYLGTNESSLRAWLTPNATTVLDESTIADFYTISIRGVHYVHAVDKLHLQDNPGRFQSYRDGVREEAERLNVDFESAIRAIEITPEMVEFFRESGAKQASDFIEQTDLPLPYAFAYALKLEVHAPKKRVAKAAVPDTEEEEVEDGVAAVKQPKKGFWEASVASATEPPALPPIADKPEELVGPLSTVFDQGFDSFFQVVEMALVRSLLLFSAEDQQGELGRVLTRIRDMPRTLTENLSKCNDIDKKISELQTQLQILEGTRAILKK